MTKYTCDACGKKFNQKSHYNVHINRKFQCKSSPQNSTISPQNSTKTTEGELVCNYCGKEYSRSDSLTRHITSFCKVKRSNDQKMEEMMIMLIDLKENAKKMDAENKQNKEEIEKLKKENAKYQKIINNTQNIGTQNIQNNYIVAYGKENLDKLTFRDYKMIFLRGMNSVPALVEKLHFDKNMPENHNVYISNLRDDYVLMYDGKIWRLKDREDALQQLYEDNSNILETKFEELIAQLDEPTIKMFKRFLIIKDSDNEKIRIIKKELKKILYENRNIVASTRKKEITE
jgi:hypothetical protein